MLPISAKDLELQLQGLQLTGQGPLKIFLVGAGGFQIFLWEDLQQMASQSNFFVASLPLPTPVTELAGGQEDTNNKVASAIPCRFAAHGSGKTPHHHGDATQRHYKTAAAPS